MEYKNVFFANEKKLPKRMVGKLKNFVEQFEEVKLNKATGVLDNLLVVESNDFKLYKSLVAELFCGEIETSCYWYTKFIITDKADRIVFGLENCSEAEPNKIQKINSKLLLKTFKKGNYFNKEQLTELNELIKISKILQANNKNDEMSK